MWVLNEKTLDMLDLRNLSGPPKTIVIPSTYQFTTEILQYVRGTVDARGRLWIVFKPQDFAEHFLVLDERDRWHTLAAGNEARATDFGSSNLLVTSEYIIGASGSGANGLWFRTYTIQAEGESSLGPVVKTATLWWPSSHLELSPLQIDTVLIFGGSTNPRGFIGQVEFGLREGRFQPRPAGNSDLPANAMSMEFLPVSAGSLEVFTLAGGIYAVTGDTVHALQISSSSNLNRAWVPVATTPFPLPFKFEDEES